jgi:glucose-6-phosphate isomerase
MANELGLKKAISDYFEGEIINQTENRAVLHTAYEQRINSCICKWEKYSS